MKPNPLKHTLLTFVFAACLLLAACTGQSATTAPQATLDTGPIYTQAAQTIEAGLRQTQAARPTDTQAPPEQPSATPTPVQDTPAVEPKATDTPTEAAEEENQPTATHTPANQQPTATQAPTATATVLIIPTATRKSSTGQVYPTITPPVDRGEFVSISPARGLQVQKNASWDISVTVKNTGGFTWKKAEYALRYWQGDLLGTPSEFLTQKDVKPGESYSFIFTMTAPDSAGEKLIYWALTDSPGNVLVWIDFNVVVTE